jgi:riboflavin synthase alpha subunit
MYTGLIESTGTLERVRRDGAGRTVRVATTTDDLATGDSVAVGGVRLTAERGRRYDDRRGEEGVGA